MMLTACGSGTADDYGDGFDDGVADAADAEDSPELLAQEGGDCLASVKEYGPRGPFRYTSRRVGRVNMTIPSVPSGCKVPVTHLANGTGASCGIYGSVTNTLASHGFIATCYESTNTGDGTGGLEALKAGVSSNQGIADQKFGSLGHSQGGQASFVVQALAEAEFGPSATYAGLAMQPASGFGNQPRGGSWQSVYARIKSPMFMFSGTADILVSEGWVRRGFAALDDSVEAYHWSASGATHIPTPNVETSEIAPPWFRWKLLGDDGACQRFKQLEAGSRWRQVQVQNAKPCGGG